MKFDVSWSEYAGGTNDKDENKIPPSIVPKTTRHCDSFNRFYTHAVLFHGVEMAHEDDKEIKEKDTSTTRIDAAVLVTLEITNIVKAIFKLEPEGIVFTQADTAIKAAFNDYAIQKGMTWEKFKDEEKGKQDSEFVKHMIDHANKGLETLDIGMKLTVVELRYHDLTPSPGNEELEKSQTKVLIAQNEGDAEIALAERQATAAKLRGEGTRQELEAVVHAVGKDGAVQLSSLDRIAKTQLRVYGEPTKTITAVSVGDGEGDKK
jgi:regulator of protease activity HflC (stomatin/prohibitin superfamily)